MKRQDTLRDFQKRVRQAQKQGQNVIIQAPTGVGKTRAALSYYMENLERKGQSMPLHCVYATPLRVLATQFHQTYENLMIHMEKVRGTDYYRSHGYEQLGQAMVAIQTGEQPEDTQYEALLTFCTIDQLLSSFLGVPYSIGKRRANLNVGAILSSYLVFDEFHLYPLLEDEGSCYGARTTVLALLSLLGDLTRFTLMTATFSTPLLDYVKNLLGPKTEIVTVSDDEVAQMLPGRERRFLLLDSSMDAECVLAQHERCSLVVCNTVVRAQKMYWQLHEATRAQEDVTVILLHSRLTDQDRTRRSQEITAALGPNNWGEHGQYHGPNIIVVATQVVEVGLDISVQALHTEIAPASSLIQRAGRCARYAHQQGVVYIYDLPDDPEGKPVSFLPYNARFCIATREALALRDVQRPMSFTDEQALIDVVHAEDDRRLLERFGQQRGHIYERVFAGLKDQDTSVRTTLIRDVAQTLVTIHDDPTKAITQKPWLWQSFAMHPGSLASFLYRVDQQKEELGLEWVCKEAVAQEQKSTSGQQVEGEEDNRAVTLYHWEPVPTNLPPHLLERILRGSIQIALPKALATYHEELGFLLRTENIQKLNIPWTTYQSAELPFSRKKGAAYKPIIRRSYQEHIQGLVRAYNSGIAQTLAYTIQQLETRLQLSESSIDQAIRLTLACHDLGKLGAQWQQWALEWQCLLYEQQGWPPYQPESDFFFGKTDYDSRSPHQRTLQGQTRTKRPNHACESVILGGHLIADSLGVTEYNSPAFLLWRASCSAIARHHTPSAHGSAQVQLKPGAARAVHQALEDARQQASWSYNLSLLATDLQPAHWLTHANDDPAAAEITIPRQGHSAELETWLYFLLVRALRLSDQRADEFGPR